MSQRQYMRERKHEGNQHIEAVDCSVPVYHTQEKRADVLAISFDYVLKVFG